jgi:hypothetical protein
MTWYWWIIMGVGVFVCLFCGIFMGNAHGDNWDDPDSPDYTGGRGKLGGSYKRGVEE